MKEVSKPNLQFHNWNNGVPTAVNLVGNSYVGNKVSVCKNH